MRQVALIQTADDRQFVDVEIRSAYYHFELNGSAHLVRINPGITPLQVQDLGDLVPPQPAPWWNPRSWRPGGIRHELANEAVAIRCFQLLGRGYVELPAADVMRNWTNFLDEATTRTTTADAKGHPVANVAGVPQEAGPIPSVVAFERDLKRLGVPERASVAFINFLIGTQRLGEASEVVQTHLWRWLIPLRENLSQIVPIMLAALFFGIQLAVDTPIGALYRGADRAWGVLFYIVPIVLYMILRRNGK